MERQKKRESKIKMFLETTEPTKTDDAWEITAIATVLYQNRPPEPAQEVVFLLNGDEIERILTSDESGQAKSTIVFPSTGSFLLCAYVVRWPGIQRTKRISVKKAEKIKIPANLSVVVFGPPGKQKLLISVAAEDGGLIAGFTGKIIDGDAAIPFTTGPDGAYEHKVRFQGVKDQVVEVRVGNKPEQIWNGVLMRK